MSVTGGIGPSSQVDLRNFAAIVARETRKVPLRKVWMLENELHSMWQDWTAWPRKV